MFKEAVSRNLTHLNSKKRHQIEWNIKITIQNV